MKQLEYCRLDLFVKGWNILGTKSTGKIAT